MELLSDLHLHSIYSDGMHTPAELVQMASMKGLHAIALSDHDSVAGIDEAISEGKRTGLEVVPAVELSVEFGSFHDVHLLGYYIDHHDPAFQEKLLLFRNRRDQRVRGILEKINEKLQWGKKDSVTYAEVSDLAIGAIGRPHIAQVLITRGFARDTHDAFTRFLVPCNVPKQYFPMEEALTEIRRLGGVAVLAHPMTMTEDRPRLGRAIAQLATMGLDGVEVLSSSCHSEDRDFLEGVANRLGLVKTGGSDFHGFDGDLEMGSGRGNLSVPYSMVLALQHRRARSSSEDVSKPGHSL